MALLSAQPLLSVYRELQSSPKPPVSKEIASTFRDENYTITITTLTTENGCKGSTPLAVDKAGKPVPIEKIVEDPKAQSWMFNIINSC